MKNKKVVIFSLIFLVIAFVAASFAFKENKVSNFEKLSKNDKGAPFIRDHSPMFGDSSKKVTIVEFLDPECGSCGAFHGAIKKVYNDHEEDVRLVVRYLDNHQNSRYAIKVLEASRLQNKFKDVLDIMFYYQNVWAQHNNPKPKLIWSFLPQVPGLDIQKLQADFDKIDVADMLATDRADSNKLGVTGTPEFFVNGKKLQRLSYEALDDLVVSELYK